MHPKKLSISDYTYNLPLERIAHHPLEQRDQSKLLVYKNGKISTDCYQHIHNYLPEQSLLVFNNTKVVEARLLFKKTSGATIEIFCLEPHHQYPDITTAMLQRQSVKWMCLIGGASKWKHGQVLEKKIKHQQQEIILQAKYLDKINDSFAVELSWSSPELSFAEILHVAGVMPLPPYIKREATTEDAERYQTIYAATDGSVAAPTAGLHFTPEIFSALSEKKIITDFVTLHVGAGTFKPVKAATMETHEMHAEFIDVTLETIETVSVHCGKYITAVGTTSLRTLESLYWLGVKSMIEPDGALSELNVKQWDPYELNTADFTVTQALNALMNMMKKEEKERLITTTQLLIVPGYRFRIVDALITNFHQPQSTLLLLVAAFIGEEWRKVYDYALENDYRFLSYGDGCLLQRH